MDVVPHALSPAKGRDRLTLAGVFRGVSRLYRKAGEETQAASKGPQLAMLRKQKGQEILEIVRPRHWQTDFLQQRLKILFGRLLAVEANDFMNGRLGCAELSCCDVVVLGFSHPFGR
jgi:hypothetical protein